LKFFTLQQIYIQLALSAITSIYLLFLPLVPLLFTPAFLGAAAPSKSSIELALLILVPGLLGGPDALIALPFDACLLMAMPEAENAIPGGAKDGGPEPIASPVPSDKPETFLEGGAILGAEVGPGVLLDVGGLLADRGGPGARGGGGVAVEAGVLSPLPFLLTQRFCSWS